MSDTNSAPESAPTDAAASDTLTGEVSGAEAAVTDTAAPIYPAATEALPTGAELGAAAATDAAAAADVTDAATEAAAATDAAAVPAAVPASAPTQPAVQTVYITAPTPPKPKGNRLIGALLAVVATVAFAAAYAAFAAVLILLVQPAALGVAVPQFLTSPFYYLPVAVFLVAMILWAILANRATWWSWVLGSFVIAAVVYFASIGVLLLMAGGISLTAVAASEAFVTFATNPALIASALIARECAIWFGAAIAKRGRKVRERNYEAWLAFEREDAQKRAEYGGAALA